MNWVIGVDASTVSVAMVATPVDDPSRIIMDKFKLHKGPMGMGEAQRHARYFVQRILSTPGITSLPVICIEAPVLARFNPQTTIKQAMVNGAIQVGLNVPEIEALIAVPPATWKKSVLGKGNLDKPGIAAAAVQLEPRVLSLGGDQDLIDAWCICRHAALLWQRTEQGMSS